MAQVVGEQIRERHLAAGPGRNRAAFARAQLHVGRHVAQAHEFELTPGEEEHVFGLELADEGFLHMAQHGAAHKAHRDRWGSGDRADVEAMQPGQGGAADAVAVALPVPEQLAVVGIGAQAITALLEKAQAPLPLAGAQASKGRR